MLKGRKVRLGLGILLVMSGIFSGFGVWAQSSLATSNTSLSSISAALFDGNSKVTDLKSLMQNYCSVVLNSSKFTQNNFVYDAKQSSFVSLLCKNINASLSFQFASDDKDYFKLTSFKQLGLQDYRGPIDMCMPNALSNDCTIAKIIPQLYNDIINDYVNMKQPNLYGLSANDTDETLMENQIDLWSASYFNNVKICKDKGRGYTDACKTVKSYIKSLHATMANVTIFKPEVILLQDQSVCAMGDDKYNILACGLFSPAGASLISFENLVYNELFYYRLFMGYYLVMVQQHPDFLGNNNLDTVTKDFTTQYDQSKSALTLTLRMMRDIYMTFPLHIGFVMYQQDLNGFGTLLAHIGPPIYTLYDKLRNVQKP